MLQLSLGDILSIAGLLLAVFGALIGVVWAMLNSKVDRIQKELDTARAEIKELHKVEITVAEFGAVYIPREESDRKFTEIYERVNAIRGG